MDYLPQAFDGCTCRCHTQPGVRHFMACCGTGNSSMDFVKRAKEIERLRDEKGESNAG